MLVGMMLPVLAVPAFLTNKINLHDYLNLKFILIKINNYLQFNLEIIIYFMKKQNILI